MPSQSVGERAPSETFSWPTIKCGNILGINLGKRVWFTWDKKCLSDSNNGKTDSLLAHLNSFTFYISSLMFPKSFQLLPTAPWLTDTEQGGVHIKNSKLSLLVIIVTITCSIIHNLIKVKSQRQSLKLSKLQETHIKLCYVAVKANFSKHFLSFRRDTETGFLMSFYAKRKLPFNWNWNRWL